MRNVILGLFALHFIFLAYLNNVYVAGLPVRSFLILLAGSLVLLLDYNITTRIRPVNLVYSLLALIGLLVSIGNDVSLPNIINGELRLLQSYLMILVSVYILEQYGLKTLILTIVGLALPSAIIGVMQGLGVEAAWSLHASLTELQNKALSDEIRSQITEVLMRPPGLTLYAIPQTYLLLSVEMLCLYAVLAYTYDLRVQVVAFLCNAIAIWAIFETETRSAIGAALLIPALFYLFLYPARSITAAGLLMLLGGIAFVTLYDSAGVDSRLTSLDDASALGRATLYKYGTELFLRQPFGYGFNFDTVEYAVEYFVNERNLFHYEAYEKAQYIVPVHNSILNLVHTYGFGGLLLLGYYISRFVRGSWYRSVFIVGAFLNSIFHNAGILSNDLFMDMVLAIMVFEVNRQVQKAPLKKGLDDPVAVGQGI